MNKLFSIARLMLLETVRDRSIWIQMVAMPLLLTTVMGLAFGGSGGSAKTVPLLVVDKDKSTYSKMVVDRLRKDKVFEVKASDETKARDQVKRGLAAGAVIVPEGYGSDLNSGRNVELKVMNLAGSGDAPALQQIVSGLASRYSTDAYSAATTVKVLQDHNRLAANLSDQAWEDTFMAADKAWEPAPVTVDARTVTASSVRGKKTISTGFSQTSIGFTLTFIMFMLVGGASSILEERQKGTLGRLLTTPTTKSTFLGGKIMGLFSTAIVQAVILIAAGRFIFGVNWGRDPLPLIVIMLAFIFAISALGILIAALSRTTAQAQSVAPILIISMAMLSGCYWPIEITPPSMQAVAKFLPTNWAMTGLVDIVVRGHGWDAVLMPTLVLIAFGAVFMTVGVWRLKFE
jgi:ABC-2 type transport system permease protein